MRRCPLITIRHLEKQQPPTAINPVYKCDASGNATLQNLVTAGYCPFGVLEYTIDGTANNGDNAWKKYNGNNWSTRNGQNNTGWSKAIPQGQYAGDYVVYYRVDADQNHYDYTNHPNDKVPVTLQRAQQVITLNKTSTTYCISWHEDFTSSRYEEAPLSLSSSGVINASLSGTTVETEAKGSVGTGTATLSVPQTANYTAADATITVNVVNHDPKFKNTNPYTSCTVDGVDHYYCAWCDNHTTVTTPAWGHNMAEKVTQEATCTQEGIILHYCTRGDYEYEERIAKKSSNHTGGYALYYSSGSSHYRSWDCGCSITEMGGHTMKTDRDGCCHWRTYCSSGSWGTCSNGNSSGGSVEHHNIQETTTTNREKGEDGKWHQTTTTTKTCGCCKATL